jgi:Concanavalin A-like lectin/glucanases superfamily
MRTAQAVPVALAQKWIAAVGVAGLLIGGCAPDEVQAPGERVTEPRLEAAVVPTGGLIGEWKLDETGGTVANDTKNNFDATVFGGAAFVAGKLGNALNLNNGTAGTGGKYAQMPSNATLDNVQEANYTISAWFQPTTLPPDATVNNRHWAVVAKASPHFGIFYNNNGKFLARHILTGGVGEQATSPTVFPAGTGAWYHLASTVNKSTGQVKLYVNGAFEDQASFTANTAAEEYGTTPFQIGRTGTIWAANGKVDQVRIYNRELSAAEIADLHDETVGPPPNTGLPAGLLGLGKNDIGTLPSAGSPFKGGHVTPTTGAQDTNIDSVLARANQHGMTLVLRLSGGPGLYTDQVGNCDMYNAQKFQANLDRFVGNQALSAALASRRAIVMAIDEPWIASYCQSISPAEVNQMGAFIKNRWPGAIVTVRGPAQFMVGGWDGQPAVNWTKIDYGWAQYNHVAAVPENQTPAQFYAGQKDSLADVNLGMIPGINVWNGGNKTCWTQPGGSSGRIYGSQEEPSIRGDFVSCSSLPNPANSINWVASPQLLRSAIDAAVLDPDAPIFLGWTHVSDDDTGVSWFVMHDLERRSDFKAAFEYWNTKGATRSSWNGWRNAK